MRFGLDNHAPRAIEQVEKLCQVTREDIRKIEARVTAQLRRD